MSKNKTIVPLILVTSLFFLWALTANLIPTLIPHLKKACRLTDFQSAFIDSAYWIAYFIIAIPAGYVMEKLGYKKAIIIGLLIAAVGTFLFYPAAELRTFSFFLAALFVVASGMAFLETAANPYMTILGSPETAAQRLNFAQAFNGLGAFVAAFFLSKIILSGREISDATLSSMTPEAANQLLTHEAKSVQMPYVIIGIILVLVAVVFMITTFPAEKKAVIVDNSSTKKFNIFEHKQLLNGIFAQFFYVGAQVCISSFFIRYTKHAAGLDELGAANYLGYLLLGFMIGRYVGTFIMQYVKPALLLTIYSIINIMLLCFIVFIGGSISIYALIGVEFFMSIMFPTIFSLAIKGLGEHTKKASSYLVMSIVGGAILPVIMGRVSDATNIQYAYLVPTVGFMVVLYFAIRNSGSKTQPIAETY
jgi:FHS family L-fucose permease-like MFS transporter